MENNIFDHYVITRFNVRLKKDDMNSLPGIEWQLNRFSLFEKYCLKAMQNQTNSKYKWFIFFDKNTPDQFDKAILAYSKNKNIEIIYSDEFNPLIVSNLVKQQLQNSKVEYIITTRLDNDDTVSCDFIENIQKNFIKCDEMALNFPIGYAYYQGKLYKHVDRSGPFISLIERITPNLRTVWYAQHRDIGKLSPISQLDNKVWVQIIHDRNVSNRVKNKRVSLNLLDKKFIIPTHNESSINIYLENLFLFPLRMVREFILTLGKVIFLKLGFVEQKNKILNLFKKR
ncbi:MAG: hypothetical protein JXR70_02325 [Spirochaetales bacterium]|nr:hypothetical protein [Spirochaetales bacterium]